MTPLTERQKTIIINNVVKAVKNIDALSKAGYNFLYLASGFIAHYDINGFKAHYEDYPLKADILANQRNNQWTNFRPAARDYEYYMAKADVYNRFVKAIA